MKAERSRVADAKKRPRGSLLPDWPVHVWTVIDDVAEARANRTHPGRSSRPTTVLKTARPTRTHSPPTALWAAPPGVSTPLERQRAAKIVPMGEGDIDYKTIFANARMAGLKYFVIEQDSAGQVSGDALADCKVAYQNLRKILS